MIRKTREEIIRLFQERFPDEDIDYSNVGEYNGFHEKIYGLHCNTCGNTFGIKPATAVRKTRTMLCGECAKELKHSKERMTFEKFLERAHAMYGVKYTYFTETWKDYQTPMHVKCNTCGYEYDQTPNLLDPQKNRTQAASLVNRDLILGLTYNADALLSVVVLCDCTELSSYLGYVELATKPYTGTFGNAPRAWEYGVLTGDGLSANGQIWKVAISSKMSACISKEKYTSIFRQVLNMI